MISSFGTLFDNLYSNTINNTFLGALFLVIVIDFVVGTMKASKFHVRDSSVGWVGLQKHFIVFFVFAFIYPFATMFSINYFVDAYALAYIYNYGNSIRENLAIMGFYTPSSPQVRVLEEIEQYQRVIGKYNLDSVKSKPDAKALIDEVSKEGRNQGVIDREQDDELIDSYLDPDNFDWSDLNDKKR